MGRYSTGATTVKEAQRIEMSYLIKRGFFSCFGSAYGAHKQSMSWTNGNSISIETIHSPTATQLRLKYTISNQYTSEVVNMDYIVLIDWKPSNLGKGLIPYFVCPVSNKRCRILYRAYGSHYFKAREAYNHRIYYEAQMSSKKYQIIDRFNTVRWKVEAIWARKRRKYDSFKGKPTKFVLKCEALEEKYHELDNLIEKFIMASLYEK
jgi:hypothetical protein